MAHPPDPPPRPGCAKGGMQSLAARVTRWVGTSTALVIALLSVVAWGLSGPLFHFSDTWQLVMNTATSIITFLMVFIIQRAQNKDALAIQLKLNEIVAAIGGADNALIDVEDLSEEQLRQLHQRYQKLAATVGRSVEAIRTGDAAGKAKAASELRENVGQKPSRG